MRERVFALEKRERERFGKMDDGCERSRWGEKKREIVCMCESEREKERECVPVCEREKKRGILCEREREITRE